MLLLIIIEIYEIPEDFFKPNFPSFKDEEKEKEFKKEEYTWADFGLERK